MTFTIEVAATGRPRRRARPVHRRSRSRRVGRVPRRRVRVAAHQVARGRGGGGVMDAVDILNGLLAEAKHERDELRAATGNLSPALVAKALAATRRAWLIGFTDDEIDALSRANFEVPS